MPQTQSQTDPIWASSGLILFDKFGVRTPDTPLKAIRAPNASAYNGTLLPQHAQLPDIGTVFVARQDYNPSRERFPIVPKFSMHRPDIGVVVGAQEILDERFSPVGTMEHVTYRIKVYWLIQDRHINVPLPAFFTRFAPPPQRMFSETVLSKRTHSGNQRTENYSRRRISYNGPPCLAFSHLPFEHVRLLRSLICETIENQYRMTGMNLVAPPPEAVVDAPATPFRFTSIPQSTAAARPRPARAQVTEISRQVAAQYADEAVPAQPVYNTTPRQPIDFAELERQINALHGTATSARTGTTIHNTISSTSENIRFFDDEFDTEGN